MFWNSETYFSTMIESNSAAPVIPTNVGRAVDPTGGGLANFAFANARALFKCVRATASLPPVALVASARISSFST